MTTEQGLKYALVMVLIIGSALLGWTTYLERKQNRKVEEFASAITGARTEKDAKLILKSFLTDTQKLDLGNSASADNAFCFWLCAKSK